MSAGTGTRPESAAPEITPDPRARAGGRLRRVRELSLVLALAILVAVTALDNPRFLDAQSLRDLLLGAAILVILAVGQTMVIITKSVDLSVGSVVGLVSFGVGKLFLAAPGTPVVVAVLIGIAAGAVCGLINGSLVAAARVPALVVTLGTLYIFRGIDYTWASGQQINATDFPASFLRLGTAAPLGIPVLAIIAAVVVAAAAWLLRAYRSGRELYAIGSNQEAARLSGVAVGRRVLMAFVLNGALAGLAGVLYAARFGTIDATAGTGMELNVVAAAVIGGVAIFGGSGTVWGAARGARLLTVIGSSLAVLRINPFWQQAVVGVLILAAIGLDRLVAVRVAARLRGGVTRGA
jgi:rhamnose transport system permease protein